MRNLVALIALSLAGCGGWFGSNDQPARAPGLEAPLAPIGGSAATGSARFAPRGDGVTMLVTVNGLAPGRYRVLVHADGNCSSPNGFSAGPPWSPPGSATPLYDRLPILQTNTEGTGTLTVRLTGVPIEGPNGLS